MLNRRLIATGLMLACSLVSTLAADFYVAQNAAGNGSGTSVANPLPLAWLNTAANWNGTGKVSPGDKVHFVGTLANTLKIPASGTPGHPITFYFEPGAKFSAPTLPNNGRWITASACSNLVFDGGSNGVIELTANGTVAANGGTMAYGHYGIAGIAAAGQKVTVQNLTIQNLYNRQTNTEPIQGSQDSTCVFWNGNFLTLSNDQFISSQDGVFVSYGSVASSNLLIASCLFSNFNHGLTIGAGAVTAPLFYNVSITRSKFLSGDMYESYQGQEYGLHRNPIFLFNESSDRSGCISNIVIANNFILGGYHPQTWVAGSGAMFFDFYNAGMTAHVRIFNNISTLVSGMAYSGGGGLVSGAGTDVLVVNNTAIGNSGVSATGTNVYFFNNIDVGGNGIVLGTWADTGTNTITTPLIQEYLHGVHSDYNIFNGQGPNSFVPLIFVNGGSGVWLEWFYDSLSAWKAFAVSYGFAWDAHSLSATVQLGANFAPLTNDTVAIGNGTNLTAFAIADNLPGLTNDFAGNPRPGLGQGNWTIGALNATVSLSAPLVSLVASPTSVTSGQYSTLTWSSVNATNLTLSGFGLVAPNGSTNVLPTQIITYITTYIATAIGTNGTFLASVSVTNLPSPPLLLRVIGYNSQ